MDGPIHEFVIERLLAARGRWTEVADGSGVSKRTIEKIARREIVDPGISHIQKLYDFFVEEDRAGGKPRGHDSEAEARQ